MAKQTLQAHTELRISPTKCGSQHDKQLPQLACCPCLSSTFPKSQTQALLPHVNWNKTAENRMVLSFTAPKQLNGTIEGLVHLCTVEPRVTSLPCQSHRQVPDRTNSTTVPWKAQLLWTVATSSHASPIGKYQGPDRRGTCELDSPTPPGGALVELSSPKFETSSLGLQWAIIGGNW